jgi:hypothetical protein
MKKTLDDRLSALLNTFKAHLLRLIDEEAILRGGEIVLAAFKLHPDKRLARAAGARGGETLSSLSAGLGRPDPKRRKGPIQLCPVPGCKNRAAPVFGMVCGDHRGVSKAKVQKYREIRRRAAARAAR